MRQQLQGPFIVQGLFGDMNGCTLWRLFWPMTFLRKHCNIGAFPCMKDGTAEYAPENMFPFAQVVSIARLSWHPLEHADGWRDLCHRHGKTCVYECDDDLFSPEGAERARLFGEYSDEELETLRLGRVHALQVCDGVTVTTPRLATYIRQWTDKPVEVVPNLLDWHWFTAQVAAGERTTPAPCIGWAGGKRPDRDLDAMAVAWGRIAQRFPQAHFYVQGYHPDILRDAVPPERLTLAPWAPLETYPRTLKNVDIGCCPLAAEDFNRAKTPIKSWEYVAAGACVVASPTVYSEVGTDGRALLLASTADEWENALATLLEDEALRVRLTQALRWRVRKFHCLDSDWHGMPAALRWLGAWQSLRQQHQAQARRGRLWLPA